MRALVVSGTGDDDVVATLHAAGATQVTAVPPADLPAALRQLPRDAGGVLVVSGDLVAHATVLRHLATVPGAAAVALVGEGGAPVDVERGQVTALRPEADGAGPGFLGALRLSAADLDALAGVPAAHGQGADDLLALLLRAGVRVRAHPVRLLVAGRAADPAAAAALRERRAAVDEDAAALRLAVKERDDFFTTFAISTWSPHVTRLAARLGLAPSAVTAVSVVLALAAAAAFVHGARPAMVAGGVLLYLSFVLDCVDGQLARYTRQFHAFGGWLDTMADRAKEYVVYAGLAWGAARAGIPGVWPLAVAAMVLQTVRHQTDFWYGALHDEAARRPAADAGGALGRISERVQADAGTVAYWLKRIVVFPIGERWALVAVAAAAADGRVALLAVLTWGAFAAAYTLTLRSLRARAMRVAVLPTVDLPTARDEAGPAGWRRVRPLPATALAMVCAAAAVLAVTAGGAGRLAAVPLVVAAVALAVLPRPHPHDGPLDWLVPAGLRGVEYLAVVAVGVAYGAPWPLLFGVLLLLALRHYDQQTRLEKEAPAAPRIRADVSWELRVMALLLTVHLAGAVAGFGLLAGYVAALLGVAVYRGWVRPVAASASAVSSATR
ncbi:MAG TPA: CDP-alcohol phosphatidyltransferase family protein [Pilimelia sp.]|nr:CDP-alcohol phosphatidyltransferase family protein [Pilimelia sp.]